MRKDATGQMRDDLPVGQGTIDTGPHRSEIALSEFGADRRAGELQIGQNDPVRRRRQSHFAQEFSADLVAEPTRAAMDGDDDITARETEAFCDGFVKDRRDLLHFEIVITGAEGPHLSALALPGAM